jgi:hypothetical protein
MPATFEEALKATLLGINESFEKADADLHREVAAAAQSLAKITQGAATMQLTKSFETADWIRYKLYVTGMNNEFHIAGFLVSARGYPIKITSADESGPPLAVCTVREELTNYFAQLASNPDSTLITAAAYIMRKK